jgi:ABC-type branched-subunit amino acid transport system substrate-binding protein
VSAHHRVFGVLTQLDAYTELMERTFLTKSKGGGLRVISEQVDGGTTDFRPLLLRLKSQRVEGIFLSVLGEPSYIDAVRQMHQLGFDVPIYSNILGGSAVSQKALGPLNSGNLFVDLDLEQSLRDNQHREVLDQVEQEFGPRRSALIFTALGIDTLRILDTALSHEKPEESLRAMKFKGIAGDLSYDADGTVLGLQFRLFRKIGESSELVQEKAPAESTALSAPPQSESYAPQEKTAAIMTRQESPSIHP